MSSHQHETSTADRLFDFRVINGPDGGMDISLHAEGEAVASAHVRNDALADMQSLLGSARAEVQADVEAALTHRFEREWADVTLTTPVLVAGRWVSRYVHCGVEPLQVGLIWYDASSRVIGPDYVPVVARSRMRHVVRQVLDRKRRGMLGVVVEILHAASE
jgi:hypothetical protein